MQASELKGLLKGQASRELQQNLHNPEYRFTLWSENGSQGFSFEDHAQYDHVMAGKVGECLLKNKSRTAVLDALEDRIYLYSLEVG
jgi:hypothetical protein